MADPAIRMSIVPGASHNVLVTLNLVIRPCHSYQVVEQQLIWLKFGVLMTTSYRFIALGFFAVSEIGRAKCLVTTYWQQNTETEIRRSERNTPSVSITKEYFGCSCLKAVSNNQFKY